MFDIWVDEDFYVAVMNATNEDWANSYLHGAQLNDGRLLPRTQTAWMRMQESWDFMGVLRARNIRLLKPPPFHERSDQKQKQPSFRRAA